MDPETGAENTADAPPASDLSGAGYSDNTETIEDNGADSSDTSEDGAAGEEGDGAAGDSSADRERFIPRERFDQVNDRVQKYQTYDPLIQQIEAMGGMDALQQALEAAQQENASRAEETRAAEIQAQIDKMVEDGDITPTLAPQLAELYKKMDRLEPVAQNIEAQRQEQQITAGIARLKTQFPEMDEDFVRLSMEVGDNPTEAARKSHERGVALISRYNAKKQEATAAIPPTPGGQGGGPQSPVSKIPDPVADPEAFGKYLEKVKSGFK